jgi:hypothetical protein
VVRVHQAPFGPNGPASSQKAIEATVEPGVGEHRLDELLPPSIELAAVVGVEHPAHERIQAAVPARSRDRASAGQAGQDLDAVGGDALHLILVSAAGVGEHDLGGVGDAGAVKLATGRVEDRLEVAEVGRVDGDLGGDNDLPVVGRRLSVVACSRPRIAVTNRESGPVMLILRAASPGGSQGLGGLPNRPPLFITSRAKSSSS